MMDLLNQIRSPANLYIKRKVLVFSSLSGISVFLVWSNFIVDFFNVTTFHSIMISIELPYRVCMLTINQFSRLELSDGIGHGLPFLNLFVFFIFLFIFNKLEIFSPKKITKAYSRL